MIRYPEGTETRWGRRKNDRVLDLSITELSRRQAKEGQHSLQYDVSFLKCKRKRKALQLKTKSINENKVHQEGNSQITPLPEAGLLVTQVLSQEGILPTLLRSGMGGAATDSLSLGRPVSVKTFTKANHHFKPTPRLPLPLALSRLRPGPLQGSGMLKFLFCLCLQQGPGTSRVFSFQRK